MLSGQPPKELQAILSGDFKAEDLSKFLAFFGVKEKAYDPVNNDDDYYYGPAIDLVFGKKPHSMSANDLSAVGPDQLALDSSMPDAISLLSSDDGESRCE
jgi:hypothetical protein